MYTFKKLKGAFIQPLRGKSAKRGFTLIELMVVLVIIAALAGILIAVVPGAMDKKNAAAISRQLEKTANAMEAYKGDVGTYLPTNGHMQELWDKTVVGGTYTAYWKGPYLDVPGIVCGTSPNEDPQDQTVPGVTYTYDPLTTSSGGTGNCGNATKIGSTKATTSYTIDVQNVPTATAKLIQANMGNKVCIDNTTDGTGKTENIFYEMEEAY